ncbi:MAG: response regulator transcription factor [Planctomycetaceae bacterium]|nr:response regulator transcription factor [Planctomycetaceae bacterium]MCB9951273.1 response regulator transcription factor [Planctomycetaceae bacterium]
MTKPLVLIVEDDLPILEGLKYNFEREGFDVLTATNGRDALQRARQALPDVIILDIMIPPPDGWQVCRELRADAKTKNTRILMLTAREDEMDEVVGFSLGADDYVSKPFKTRPLIERVKALLRRTPPDSDDRETLSISGIEVDRTRYVATLDGQELILTPTEFRMLWTLASQPGRTFTRNELLDCARGEDANSSARTIDVHIRSLRVKLGERAEVIDTVRGIGYRFKPMASK